MPIRYTHHAKQKFIRIKKAGFNVSKEDVEMTLSNPVRVEHKEDGTHIAMNLLDERHVLRVVYRREHDIILIITFYPGRRKAYAV